MDILKECVRISASPKYILQFLIDPKILPLWSPTKIKVKYLTKQKSGSGTKFLVEFIKKSIPPTTYEILKQTDVFLECSFEGLMFGKDRWDLKAFESYTDVYNSMEFNSREALTLFGWKAIGLSIATENMKEKMLLLKDVVESSNVRKTKDIEIEKLDFSLRT